MFIYADIFEKMSSGGLEVSFSIFALLLFLLVVPIFRVNCLLKKRYDNLIVYQICRSRFL